jgi:hypothetical protein
MYNIHNPVLSDRVIHHVNGNKVDNRIENPEGMTKNHQNSRYVMIVLMKKCIIINCSKTI